MSTPVKRAGIVLMTYGSATTSKDVSTFLRHVYPDPSPELIAEFERRFDIVGSSPLVQITLDQAKSLQTNLDQQAGVGNYLVEAGFLHAEPFIEDAFATLSARGAQSIFGLLLSPQYSPHIMRGYDQALAAAAKRSGYGRGQAAMLGAWPTEPKFIELTSRRLTKVRAQLNQKYGHKIPVVFTTHSLPEVVVKRDPSYLDQLQATIDAIVARTGLPQREWHYGYQSAGHTPEPWLKPDLNDIIAELRQQKARAVLIVPIQFLADHLEILYDLDTAARQETEAGGVRYHRLPVANTNPLFIEALSDIVGREAL
jgi:ferrochelatase